MKKPFCFGLAGLLFIFITAWQLPGADASPVALFNGKDLKGWRKLTSEWQSFDVVFRAPRFDAGGKKIENARFVKVTHNGQVVQENVEVTGPTRAATYENSPEKPLGPLMLQGDHGPVAYRNITFKRVKLD